MKHLVQIAFHARPVAFFASLAAIAILTSGIVPYVTAGSRVALDSENAAAPAPASAFSDAPSVDDPILDGEEKSIVIVGYSTSYAWPVMLQDMLDEHASGDRTYHLVNAVIGGSPVNRWIDEPGTQNYDSTFGAMARDFFGDEPRLLGDVPSPTVAICQQSLQRTGAQNGPVTAANDADGIKMGADAIEKLAFQLRDLGIDRVVIGMHIYKEGYEPEVGNERFALHALLQRGHAFISEGPDTWSLTIGEHPEAFTEDGLHPNDHGMKIMAQAWYRTLAGENACQDIIDRMHERAYDTRAITQGYLASRRVP